MFPESDEIAALGLTEDDEDELLSPCCGAPLIEDTDLCSECGEHV